MLCKCFIKGHMPHGPVSSLCSKHERLQYTVQGTRWFPSTFGWGCYLRTPPCPSPKELKATGFFLSEDPDRECGPCVSHLRKAWARRRQLCNEASLCCFYIFRLCGPDLEQNQQTGQLPFQKLPFPLCSHSSEAFSQPDCNLGGSEREGRGRSQFWKPMSHTLKHGC